MKVCIRCNPVSELQETDEGLRCRVHGDQYVIEEQPDPARADAYLPAETHEEAPQ
jgi:hypothetical protein